MNCLLNKIKIIILMIALVIASANATASNSGGIILSTRHFHDADQYNSKTTGFYYIHDNIGFSQFQNSYYETSHALFYNKTMSENSSVIFGAADGYYKTGSKFDNMRYVPIIGATLKYKLIRSICTIYWCSIGLEFDID